MIHQLICKPDMLIHPLPCVSAFVDALNESLQAVNPAARLTSIQRRWLTFVLMGIVVTSKLCWAAFEGSVALTMKMVE